jgi:two-component system sensor histidine kinase PhoQ
VSRPSLRRRLILSVLAVLVVFFALTVFLLDVLFRHAAERSLREVLDAQLVSLVAAADPDGPESATPTAPLDARFDTPGSGLYAEIRSASGETIWRSQSTTGAAVQFGPPLEGGQTRFVRTEVAGTTTRLAVLSRGIVWDDLNGSPARFTFSVASSLRLYDRQVASFRQQLIGWFSGLALLLRWMGQPVRRLEREIKQVEAGERETLGDAWPRELAAVTSNLNALLDAERTRIKRYRDTLGNLAHSLKTPLAVMRQSLGAEQGGDAASPALHRTMNAEIDRMSDIIEHQMKRAAASGGVLLGQAPVDVAPIVTELRAALLKVYGNKDLLFEISVVPEAQFIGDRADLTELLGNLMDNACKWARGRVRVQVTVDFPAIDTRRALHLCVEDDGPGIAETDRARVLQRGGRVDEATPGHGIGLPMVHDTVALYGGSMRIDASNLGGARFELELPGRSSFAS